MADWSVPRKPRKSNFSTDEVDVLVDSVKAYYHILYGKYAKRATNRWIRQKAWLDILKKVNGVSIEKRTLQEVKNKWKKCQYALKEKVSKGSLADDPGEFFWDDTDSMPLQERLSKVAAQEKIASASTGPLKSQSLSPTKLKVTRQGPRVVKHVERPQSPINEEMCLRWNSHHSNMQTAFPNILSKEQYVDVTLAAEGKTLKCHRLILSSCSPYFDEILSGISPFQHPVLFMRDIPFWILKSLCDFMYAGEVHIFQNKLEELLTVAEALKIKGLAGKSSPPENQEDQSHKNDNSNNNNNNNINTNKEKKKNQHEKPERFHHHNPPPLQKNPIFTHQSNNFESTSHDYDDDLLDPLDLLEPLYEEAAEEKKPSTIVKPKENKYNYQPVKKPFTRRLRKRKYSEQQREPSPPPVFTFRKGTRSRPNVKIPKYYHSDYSNPQKTAQNAQTDPLLEVDEIKTEPIDVEDNLIDYNDSDHYLENSLDPANCDSPIIITNAKLPPPPVPQNDKFKKIKLSKPIITEVHTIEEANSGGLEVIKITLQQPGGNENEEKKEGGADPLKKMIETDVSDNVVTEEVPVENKTEKVEAVQEETQNEEAAIEETVVKIVQVEERAKIPEVVAEEDNVESETVKEPEVQNEAVSEEVPPEEETDVENVAVAEILENIQETTAEQQVVEELEDNEDVAAAENTSLQEIRIEDVRTTCLEEIEQQSEEEQARTASLDHLEKEAMNVANAITLENQAGPPDIE